MVDGGRPGHTAGMRSFACPTCGQLVFFENSECLRCHSALGFVAESGELIALEPADGLQYQRCSNELMAACNWVVPLADDAATALDHDGLCLSCRLTRTRPNDSDPEALASFAETEAAKRRLVFQLLELGLPIDSYEESNETGLAFDLLSSQFENVMIGHAAGVITLNLSESDDAYRERMRHELGEPYRTMLGHLRHEIGHYYFPLIVGRDESLLARARELFGDETADYGDALDEHYQSGPPSDWLDHYVSSYATMHPFEDWAETFAHYLHIRDTLQTAGEFGMNITGTVAPTSEAVVSHPEAGEDAASFGQIVTDWLPLTYALNAVNRSMGHADVYPFVLAPAVIKKLTFVHHVVSRQSGSCSAGTRAVIEAERLSSFDR
jgi:hypothetical protein